MTTSSPSIASGTSDIVDHHQIHTDGSDRWNQSVLYHTFPIPFPRISDIHLHTPAGGFLFLFYVPLSRDGYSQWFLTFASSLICAMVVFNVPTSFKSNNPEEAGSIPYNPIPMRTISSCKRMGYERYPPNLKYALMNGYPRASLYAPRH